MEPRSGALSLLALLALPGAALLSVEETYVALNLQFFQESLPSQAQSGQYLDEVDGEEVFHVDWGQKETVWRLHDLETFISFDAQGALGSLAIMKQNLGALMKRSNQSQEGHFVYQARFTCGFPNGVAGPGAFYLESYIYGRQEYLRFDSPRGTYEAITDLGEPDARTLNITELGKNDSLAFNRNKDILERRRAQLDVFCRHNYGIIQPFASARKLKPQLKISPTEPDSPSSPHTLLVCTVGGFFPAKINVTWLRNGQEEDDGKVVSTNVIRNGDWTFRIQVMLEAQPKRGDVYTCQVEHASLPSPDSVQWEPQSESARSKMWTGVVGLLLGLVFLLPGLALYLKKRKKKRGPAIPPPAALMS